MKRFRLHTEDSVDYPINREEHDKRTQGKAPYVMFDEKHHKHAYAVCMGCTNPIHLLGIYRKIEGDREPYGKHCKKTLEGITSYSKYEYEHCHYAAHAYGACPKEQRYEKIGPYEERICRAMRDYFDKALYVLQESIGFRLTDKMARVMLTDYCDTQGYLYKQHTVENLPWMLMYMSDFSYDPFGRWIKKDSILHDKLSMIDTVVFQELLIGEEPSEEASEEEKNQYKRRKKNAEKYNILQTTHFTQISVMLLKYTRKIQDGEETEKAMITVNYRYNGYDHWTEAAHYWIEIDSNWFRNIIESENAMKHRNKKLLDLAKEIMPEM